MNIILKNAKKIFTSTASNSGSGGGGNETAATIAAINHGTSAKTTLVDADEVTGQDSANSFSLIRTTWLNVWSYISKKIESITNGGNTNYLILAADKVIVTGIALTAPRIWTLPSAASVNAGNEKIINDAIGTITSTNTITIAVQSGQYLNNVLNGTEVMNNANAFRRLISDGVNNWTFDAGIVRLSATQTLTNKTIKQRVVTVTQSATPTFNIDNGSIFQMTGLAQAITSMSTNMSGTPYDGQCLCFEITDNGTARAITLGSNFVASTAQALPTTTVASVTLQIYTKYRAAIGKHEVQFVN